MPDVAAIKAAAPPAPPCFADRMSWLEYLAGAASSAKHPVPKNRVVLIQVDGRQRFNPDFCFCTDCSAQHSFRMHRQGKCVPNHVKNHMEASSYERSV